MLPVLMLIRVVVRTQLQATPHNATSWYTVRTPDFSISIKVIAVIFVAHIVHGTETGLDEQHLYVSDCTKRAKACKTSLSLIQCLHTALPASVAGNACVIFPTIRLWRFTFKLG